MKATAIATVVASGAIVSSAQEAAAFNITAGSVLKLRSLQDAVLAPGPSIDFNGTSSALDITDIRISNSSTGSFASLVGTLATISNLNISDLANNPIKSSWIHLYNGPTTSDDDILFNLLAVTRATSESENGLTSALATFKGQFVTRGGKSLANGTAVAFLDDNAGPWSMSITATEATPVPTPALIPGLIGMGIAAVRKRQAKAAA